MKFSLPQEKISELSYGLVSQRILLPYCVSCHRTADALSLESYPEVLKNSQLIRDSVFTKKSMPKRGFLSHEELAILWNWIVLGAPEQAQNGSPVPTPEPLLPTFASINKRIFQASCKDCHKPGGSGKRVPLDRDFLLNSPLELVLPGNPDESGLVLSLERNDSDRMPPSEEGYSPLTAEEKATVRKWIENGAKD